MNAEPRHRYLSLLIACAIMPGMLLLANKLNPDTLPAWLDGIIGVIVWSLCLGLIFIPPLRQPRPWRDRIGACLIRLACWSIFTAITAYAFGISPR